MIKFPCPHCATNNESEDADAGQVALCGNCQQEVTIPAASLYRRPATKPMDDSVFRKVQRAQHIPVRVAREPVMDFDAEPEPEPARARWAGSAAFADPEWAQGAQVSRAWKNREPAGPPTHFEHPLNGHRVEINRGTWRLMCMVTGPIYPLAHGLWVTAILFLIFGTVLAYICLGAGAFIGVAVTRALNLDREFSGFFGLTTVILLWYLVAWMFSVGMEDEYRRKGWRAVQA